MKKELNKAKKKLTLGKMTVAKMRLSEHQMRYIFGGNDVATKPIRPASKRNEFEDINDNMTCGTGNHTGSGT